MATVAVPSFQSVAYLSCCTTSCKQWFGVSNELLKIINYSPCLRNVLHLVFFFLKELSFVKIYWFDILHFIHCPYVHCSMNCLFSRRKLYFWSVRNSFWFNGKSNSKPQWFWVLNTLSSVYFFLGLLSQPKSSHKK